METKKNIGVFIDRDGVIIELQSYSKKSNKSFITDKKQINFIEGTASAINKLNNKGIKVIIVTNQPQIGRGLVTEDEIIKINNYIISKLKENKAIIDGYYYCPHHPEKGIGKYKIKCDCRKPEPGMIISASKEFNINLSESYMIGDRISDIKAGNLAGCKTIGVKTGYACDDGFSDAVPDKTAINLEEAVNIILEDLKCNY